MLETNIKALRDTKGIGIRALSKLTGINRGRLSVIENGIYHPTNIEVDKLVGVLGAPVELHVVTRHKVEPRIDKRGK